MGEMRYRTVHEDLLAAFPELRDPYRRLFDDWDDFEGEPPGQYIDVLDMDRDGERHSRLWDDPWVADALATQHELIVSILRGEPDLRAPA